MRQELTTPRFLIIAGIILTAAFVRLIPHPPNFAPIAAMALLGGAYYKNKTLAFAIPIIAMFLTDLIIGLHSTMIIVYAAFALIVFIGMVMIKQKKAGNILLASITASVSFFIITNFGMWMLGTQYPKTGTGLLECYIAAIPFFQTTLLGDLFFVTIFFGLFELVKTRFPQLAEVK